METVDLGLPSGTLWAEMNIGADKIGDTGSYAAFGNTTLHDKSEIEEFNLFSEDCRENTLIENNIILKYTPGDCLTLLEKKDDIASTILGEEFSIPTKDDFQELIDNTTCAISTFNNEKCLKMKSNTNDAEIYFPCTGWASSGKIKLFDEGGIYMTANISNDFISSWVFAFDAMNAEVKLLDCARRFIGLAVRAICKK